MLHCSISPLFQLDEMAVPAPGSSLGYLDILMLQHSHVNGLALKPFGGVQDKVFNQASRSIVGKSGKKSKAFTDDHVLMCSYLIALQFFRTFRWTRAGQLHSLACCKEVF